MYGYGTFTCCHKESLYLQTVPTGYTPAYEDTKLTALLSNQHTGIISVGSSE